MIQDERELRRWLKWWGLACLAVIAINMLACTTATTVIPINFGTPMKGGETVCDIHGNPVVLINTMYVGTPKQDVVLAHENTHVSQMYRHGGCKKMAERYASDDRFAFDMEAQAFCEDMKLQQRTDPTFNKQHFVNRMVDILAYVYPFNLTAEEVRKRLPCK